MGRYCSRLLDSELIEKPEKELVRVGVKQLKVEGLQRLVKLKMGFELIRQEATQTKVLLFKDVDLMVCISLHTEEELRLQASFSV
jgi:hypothetical protein